MTLEDFYFISQIGAAFALVISLIFVGIQIRQNTAQAKRSEEATKAAATEAQFRSLMEWYYSQSPATSAILAKASLDYDGLNAEERFQFLTTFSPLIVNLQEAHTKREEGLLSEERWAIFDATATRITLIPAIAQGWEELRYQFSADFQSYFDEKVQNRPVSPISEVWAGADRAKAASSSGSGDAQAGGEE